jgi:hypothetical protein
MMREVLQARAELLARLQGGADLLHDLEPQRHHALMNKSVTQRPNTLARIHIYTETHKERERGRERDQSQPHTHTERERKRERKSKITNNPRRRRDDQKLTHAVGNGGNERTK